MKTHTTIGCEILEKSYKDQTSEFYRYSYDICRYHHERWDGKGYPDHLAGDEIPIYTQVVAIADVYDALVSPRVYKSAYANSMAYEMIMNGECGQFSPDEEITPARSNTKIISNASSIGNMPFLLQSILFSPYTIDVSPAWSHIEY